MVMLLRWCKYIKIFPRQLIEHILSHQPGRAFFCQEDLQNFSDPPLLHWKLSPQNDARMTDAQRYKLSNGVPVGSNGRKLSSIHRFKGATTPLFWVGLSIYFHTHWYETLLIPDRSNTSSQNKKKCFDQPTPTDETS